MAAMAQLATNLGKIRKKFGFSQKNVAQLLNVSPTLLRYYETDKREPTPLHLTQLADLYAVNIADLFEEKALNSAVTLTHKRLKLADLQAIAQFNRIVKNYSALTDLVIIPSK